MKFKYKVSFLKGSTITLDASIKLRLKWRQFPYSDKNQDNPENVKKGNI